MERLSMEQLSAVIVGDLDACARVFGQGRQEEIARRTALAGPPLGPEEFVSRLEQFSEVQVIFATWGMPAVSEEQWAMLPRLEAVFYAAGSVQSFAGPLLARGITVVSAWRANAVPVAEFTLAQILLSAKGYFRDVREFDGSPGSQQRAFRGPGSYGETVALLGAGAIGRALIALLRPFRLRVIVFDPFLSEDAAQALGVEKVGLEDAFAQGWVVSNHLADKDELAGFLHGALFARLRPGATFINTGRGRTVNEPDLVQTLRRRPDLTALLDVTDPEPPLPGSALFTLPNLRLSSHIAGSIGDETLRLADFCLKEFDRYAHGQPLQHQVTPHALATMA